MISFRVFSFDLFKLFHHTLSKSTPHSPSNLFQAPLSSPSAHPLCLLQIQASEKPLDAALRFDIALHIRITISLYVLMSLSSSFSLVIWFSNYRSLFPERMVKVILVHVVAVKHFLRPLLYK